MSEPIIKLAESYFGVGGEYDMDFTTDQIQEASDQFDAEIYPLVMLSVLGRLRQILVNLVMMSHEEDEEVDVKYVHAFDHLGEIFDSLDELPQALN